MPISKFVMEAFQNEYVLNFFVTWKADQKTTSHS